MKITALMNVNCISFDQHLLSKDEVFQYLSKQLFEQGYISEQQAFLDALYYRESLSETGLGEGIAIPHGKAACVIKPGIAFVRLADEIAWESLDGKAIRYVFMLAIPEKGGDQDHIKMISELARSLIRPTIIKKVTQTTSATALLSCFGKEENS